MHTVPSTSGIGRGWFRFAFASLLLFLAVRGLLLEAFTIPTSSMESTLLVGDFLFVNKAVFGSEIPGTDLRLPAFRDPGHGEIVVFRPPHDRRRVYVKRVVGIPGDTLEMRNKTLLRNGIRQEEDYARYEDRGGDAVHPGMRWQSDFLAAAGPLSTYLPSRDNWGPLVVPPGKYFVLGDNRDNSEDSRYWGFIHREDIKGKPWRVYLSLAERPDAPGGWLSRMRWARMGRYVR